MHRSSLLTQRLAYNISVNAHLLRRPTNYLPVRLSSGIAKMPMPDEHIHPHATGRAAETVAAHQAENELVFYSGWFCPFVQRSWIALEEKGAFKVLI
jgi:hypothetical protein